jgi:stage V sporulation protein AE
MEKRQVIVVTDGDKNAQKAVEKAGQQLHLRTISASAGNPTPLYGPDLVELVKKAPRDPVLVMVDDCGNPKVGDGEQVLQYLGSHPEIEILGVVAVASNAPYVDGVEIDFSVDRDCNIIDQPVYKNGLPEPEDHLRVEGDTVDILNQMNVPVIVGIGDIGKMGGHDSVRKGCAVTTRAIQEILNRSGNG